MPPGLRSPSSGGLKDRFDNLDSFFTSLFYPYLFNYLNQVQPLDQIRFNAQLYPVADGSRTEFVFSLGQIRLDPTGAPQAILMWTRDLLIFTPDPTQVTFGRYTVITTKNGNSITQKVIVGQAPQKGDYFAFPVVILQ